MAYVAEWDAGLRIYDVMDPSRPTLLGAQVGPDDVIEDVAISGRHTYLTDRHAGLRVVDVADPAAPTSADWFIGSGISLPVDVHVENDLTYVADSAMGLTIFDVRDLARPVLIGHNPQPVGASIVDVQADTAYVLCPDRLYLLDVSNSRSPHVRSYYKPGPAPLDVSVSESVACLALGEDGLDIVDVSNPDTPRHQGSYTSPTSRVFMSGDTAYVIETSSSLRVLDITNPTAPTPKGALPVVPPFSGKGLWIDGPMAYVTGRNALQIIDVSNPSELQLLGFFQPLSVYVSDVNVSDGLAFLAESMYGLEVVDIGNPSSPTLLCKEPLDKYPTNLCVSGQNVFVAADSGGLWTLRYTRPPYTAVLSPWRRYQ
jgi:hypothetical protein